MASSKRLAATAFMLASLHLRAGDWVIQVEGGVLVTLPEHFAGRTRTVEPTDVIPWAVNALIPASRTLVMRRYKVPRAVARVYRVVEDFVVPDFPPRT